MVKEHKYGNAEQFYENEKRICKHTFTSNTEEGNKNKNKITKRYYWIYNTQSQYTQNSKINYS